MNLELLKHYNNKAESCLDIFEELRESDPDLADVYYNDAKEWIDKTDRLIRGT